MRAPSGVRTVLLDCRISGGVIAGNLTDRLLPSRHAVVDFIYFYVQQRDGGKLGFPAFNVADTAICTGVGLIFLITWKNEHTPKPATSDK